MMPALEVRKAINHVCHAVIVNLQTWTTIVNHIIDNRIKEWTGNASKSTNVADATSVIWLDTLYFATL